MARADGRPAAAIDCRGARSADGLDLLAGPAPSSLCHAAETAAVSVLVGRNCHRAGGTGPGVLAGWPVPRPVALRQRSRSCGTSSKPACWGCWPWPWACRFTTGWTRSRARCWCFIRSCWSGLLGMPRLLFRAWKDNQNSRLKSGVALRVLILGAGQAGEALVRDLRRSGAYQPVGLLDDAAGLRGTKLQGVPVLGRRWTSPVIAPGNRRQAARDRHAVAGRGDACSAWWPSAKARACLSAPCRAWTTCWRGVRCPAN